MTALVLSIAVLATGAIVQDVEAKGKPVKADKPQTDDKESTSGINFSCNDRKGALSCKASSSDKIGDFDMQFPNGGGIYYTGSCQRTQSFGDTSIETGVYAVSVYECGTGNTYDYEITVDSKLKITSTVEV